MKEVEYVEQRRKRILVKTYDLKICLQGLGSTWTEAVSVHNLLILNDYVIHWHKIACDLKGVEVLLSIEPLNSERLQSLYKTFLTCLGSMSSIGATLTFYDEYGVKKRCQLQVYNSMHSMYQSAQAMLNESCNWLLSLRTDQRSFNYGEPETIVKAKADLKVLPRIDEDECKEDVERGSKMEEPGPSGAGKGIGKRAFSPAKKVHFEPEETKHDLAESSTFGAAKGTGRSASSPAKKKVHFELEESKHDFAESSTFGAAKLTGKSESSPAKKVTFVEEERNLTLTGPGPSNAGKSIWKSASSPAKKKVHFDIEERKPNLEEFRKECVVLFNDLEHLRQAIRLDSHGNDVCLYIGAAKYFADKMLVLVERKKRLSDLPPENRYQFTSTKESEELEEKFIEVLEAFAESGTNLAQHRRRVRNMKDS